MQTGQTGGGRCCLNAVAVSLFPLARLDERRLRKREMVRPLHMRMPDLPSWPGWGPFSKVLSQKRSFAPDVTFRAPFKT